MVQSLLQKLRAVTSVVADSGEFDELRKYSPDDATTNPTLLLRAAESEKYRDLVTSTVKKFGEERASTIQKILDSKKCSSTDTALENQLLDDACDELAVAFGVEILKLIPGVVSTEVDARLSFDTAGSVVRARKLISIYAKHNIPKSRVLIKLATTWEGVQAARALQAEGINCNMTLVFQLQQAVAAAEAGAFLVSPFVGRIFDWCKIHNADKIRGPGDHPGVHLVRDVYRYFQEHGYRTIVMGASFRSSDEVLALAGCNKLTIGLKFLNELEGRSDAESFSPTAIRAPTTSIAAAPMERLELTETRFRWNLNEDIMTEEKLAEGIRTFTQHYLELRDMVRRLLGLSFK